MTETTARNPEPMNFLDQIHAELDRHGYPKSRARTDRGDAPEKPMNFLDQIHAELDRHGYPKNRALT